MPSGRETASKFVEPSSPLSNNRASASDTRKSAGALTKKAAPAKPTKEVILAGDFPKTRIFMSSGEGSSRKWADTEIQGSLEIVLHVLRRRFFPQVGRHRDPRLS